MFNQLIATAEDIRKKCEDASILLNTFPRGPMGLTPDEVKFSPEFKEAKANYDFWNKKLRDLNGFISKNYKKELNKYNQDRRAARGR